MRSCSMSLKCGEFPLQVYLLHGTTMRWCVIGIIVSPNLSLWVENDTQWGIIFHSHFCSRPAGGGPNCPPCGFSQIAPEVLEISL